MESRTQRKIKTLAQLGTISRRLKRQGYSVVQCHGVFDLIHPGHIRHFQSAKREGDFLMVTLTADKYVKRGPGRPIFNEHLRAETLAALAAIDYVAIVDAPTAIEAISIIRPSVYAKGPDYQEKGKDITGMIEREAAAVKAVRGRLYITHDITFSSSALINNHLAVYPPATRDYLRHLARAYPLPVILDYLNQVAKLRVLVIGDAIIDQYHYCYAMGRSSKEPLVVNKFTSAESFAGGTLATANHVASLCQRVDLLTVLGATDSWQPFIEQQLAARVRAKFYRRRGVPTTIKRRYISNVYQRKIFEICFMDDTPLTGRLEQQVIKHLARRVPQYDLVIVNDFGHGFLTPRIIRTICRYARCLALNVQTNSANIGFNVVTKYPRADYICVDEMELRFATHDRYSNLKKIARRVYDTLDASLLIATRGADGSIMYSEKEGFKQAPALADRVVDTVGAGDAVFAYTAPAFAAKLPPEVIGFIGNAAGSLAVQIVGNREAVQAIDLIKFITRLLKQL